MKNILKIICILLLSFFSIGISYGGAIDFNQDNSINNITDRSINSGNTEGKIEDNIMGVSENIFGIVKVVLGGLFVIMLVYAGTMMILSMGSDEEQLTSAKKSVWFAVLGLLFINIPGTLFDAFSGKSSDDVTGAVGDTTKEYEKSLFVNSDIFGNALGGIIDFLQIAIVSFAILIIVIQGLKIMTARGKDEDISEAKNKIVYSVLGLIFIGIMESWRYVVFTGDFAGAGAGLFSNLANLALFFAGPVAIFFLSLAGYYYITANGEEEKTKKAKNIIINTLLATLILLAIFTFFNDLSGISFGGEYDDLVE